MENIRAEFEKQFGHPPAVVTRAPGRVNLLGEHVDYNDGPVLPAAIDRAVYIAAAPQEGSKVEIAALDMDRKTVFNLDELDRKVDVDGNPLPQWALYPAGVAWALQKTGRPAGGMKAVFTSNIPIGSGLSSSAAVLVGFGATFQAFADWEVDRMTLARLAQRGENVYVGVNCGLMDQFASANGVAGHALYFDTRSLEWEPVPLPSGTAIVIADSGIRRALANSAYNERREACERAVAILKEYMPHIQALRDVSTTEFAAYSDRLPPEIRKRAEHVVKEIARVQSAVSALRREERRSFGALMFAGHASLRDLYEVSLPELDALVELARDLPGCIGARLTGAGFGGCTVNLVEEDQAAAFIEGLKQGYQEKTGREAQVYLCQASDGVQVDFYQ